MFTRGWLLVSASSPDNGLVRAIIPDPAAVLISRNARRPPSHLHGLSLHGSLGLADGLKQPINAADPPISLANHRRERSGHVNVRTARCPGFAGTFGSSRYVYTYN